MVTRPNTNHAGCKATILTKTSKLREATLPPEITLTDNFTVLLLYISTWILIDTHTGEREHVAQFDFFGTKTVLLCPLPQFCLGFSLRLAPVLPQISVHNKLGHLCHCLHE